MSNIIRMPGAKDAPRSVRSKMDTIVVTQQWVESLETPAFQRPLRINEKVRAIAEQIKQDQVIPGVIVLGRLNGKMYRIDGQHRLEAFKLSALREGYADVRIVDFDSFDEMGKEFVELNSAIARMRPDDFLRGLGGSLPSLRRLRSMCPFIGYDQIRRSEHSPLLSMATALRCWRGAAMDTPTPPSISVVELAREISLEQADQLGIFLLMANKAWGRDIEYARLWGALNLTLCMWLWVRVVTGTYSAKSAQISKENFLKGMMSLSADAEYLGWLLGRKIGDRDRSPAYGRIRKIVAHRVEIEVKKKINLPSPPWFGSR